MFETKQDKLFEASSIKKTSLTSDALPKEANPNSFLAKGLKKSAETQSENGALKYTTTGNPLVDQFSQLGRYRELRSYADVDKDMRDIWEVSPRMSLALTLFIRTITRQTDLFGGNRTRDVQRGAGMIHEGILRMMWININHRDLFWKNVPLFISIGSWKDIITMLNYDLQYHGWKNRQLDWNQFGQLLLVGLNDEDVLDSVRKYIPSIRNSKACTTLHTQADNFIAMWLCSLLFKSTEGKYTHFRLYRQLKSSGKAHVWQQQISRSNSLKIDFNTIPGRALSLMVNSKFLANQKLEERYTEFVESKPVLKYTGHVHELFGSITPKIKPYQIHTLNKQFDGLIELGKKGGYSESGLIVVRDTSASMRANATGTRMSCGNVAKALALYFSQYLKGSFNNAWIEFNSEAKMHIWKGETAYDKWTRDASGYVGSTDFMAVCDLFIDLKMKGVPERDFPTGFLCISDGEFNPANLNMSNVETFKNRLQGIGFSKEYTDDFKVVLWNLQSDGRGNKFDTYGDVPNVFYFSGYEPSIISFLTNGRVERKIATVKTATELFEDAMNQEVLNLIET